MSVKYIYDNLITDIEDRENTVKDIQKVQSTTYKDSELYSVDFQVFKKIQDAVDYGMDNPVKLTSNAIHTAEELKYTNTSTSLSNMHINQCNSVNNLSRLVVNLGWNSEKAYELVATDFSEYMSTVSTNIEDSYEWAEIVRKDCDNVDNFNAETDTEHTVSYYEKLLSAHVETARDFLGKADDALEVVEEILNKRGFKLAGAGDFHLSLSTTIGAFAAFGENAETVRSIFEKTGIDPTSEEGQALWMEIDALIASDPETAASELKKIAENIPESWSYWESQSNWDSPVDISTTLDGSTPISQFYEVDGVRLYFTRFEMDDSNTPILDTIMNKASAYSVLDHIGSYPDEYKRALGNVPYIEMKFSTGERFMNDQICSDFSLDRQMIDCDSAMETYMWMYNDYKNETVAEALSVLNPQESTLTCFSNFVRQDLENHEELVANIGQDNYNNIMQAIGKGAEENGKTYQTVVTTDSVTINQIYPNGKETTVLRTAKDNNGQSILLGGYGFSQGSGTSYQYEKISDGCYRIQSCTMYRDGIKTETSFYSNDNREECTLVYGSTDSPQDKLVIPNRVIDSSGTSHKTAELTITGGTVTVTYLGVDGNPLPEGQDYEKYWSDLGYDVSGTSDHFDEMGEKYNN